MTYSPEPTESEQTADVLRLRHFANDSLVPPEPPSLAQLERRRAHLWLVASVLLLALSAAVLVLFWGVALDELLPDVPAIRWSFLGLSLAFILYVVDQERRLRRLTAALFEERILTIGLQARIADLSSLTKVGRIVNSVLSLEEVLEVLLTSAFELTGSTTGSVMLLENDTLRVAASAGPAAAPPGAVIQLGSGVAGWVAERREPIVITGRLTPGQFPGTSGGRRRDAGSSICSPLMVGGELLGVLAVERPPGAAPFSSGELRSVALFAEHAATAVNNAFRYEEERHTVARLADALEVRSEFVATMVHELKTPLTVILGFADLLAMRWNDLDDARRAAGLAAIRSQSDRLHGMVDEVLRSSSVEAGAEVRRAPVDLSAMLRDVGTSVAGIAAAREGGERAVRVTGGDEPVMVWGDQDALHHVFENLLENAVKYSPPGSPVEIDLAREERAVVVSITDHGAGIADEDLPYVFERFRQSGPTSSGGVGLGLYIVRTLVQAHGGVVSVRSRVGEGSTFSVSLPVRHAQREVAAAGAANGAAPRERTATREYT